MDKENIYDEIFDKPCSVCGRTIKKDIYEQGNCPYCSWRNSSIVDENADKVIYPNLISLNKAKELYAEGKPFEPNLDEFLEALFFYSEVQFEYNGIYYGIILTSHNEVDNAIEMFEFNTTNSQFFDTKEDFKEKAKIGNKFLKDIWNETTDRYWLQ